MDSEKYILALDQGTTSSRAIIVNRQGQVVASSQRGFEQIFPRPGWVEHDASEIWYTQSSVAAEAVAKANLTGLDIACIGITNQRETTVIWDRETSLPVYNAIVWQDRRTAAYCEELKGKGYEQAIHQKTGLILDAYFSATKIKWILDNIEGVRERAEKGKLCFGTIDSWLVWRFTRGGAHVTDVSNASRTMLFNIHTQQWDDDLLDLFGIPRAILPEVKASSEVYCDTATTLFSTKIPISGIAGDQQAALFGQLCVEQGMSKTTYGTGCFVMMNTGDRPVFSKNGMLTTIAWKIGEQITYALEGSVFVGGAAIQWLRDGLEIVRSAHETEELALSVADSDGVYFVPALTGLGAPYWDQYARGLLVGLTRGTTRAHIVRAALEGIAFEVYDVIRAMEHDATRRSTEMKVDGGAVANNFLMQFQSDLTRGGVVRPKILETTAMGAAYLAGLAVGFWKDTEEIGRYAEVERRFEPEMPQSEAERRIERWHEAVGRAGGWMVVTTAWALAVFVGVVVAAPYSGAHLNPAVTFAFALTGQFPWERVLPYVSAQMIGAALGAVLVWLAYRPHFEATPDPRTKLAVFCTAPEIRRTGWNFLTELIGTFSLLFIIFYITVGEITLSDNISTLPVGLGSVGALPVAFTVWVIGLSLGGPTGYAINPARDLAPRVVHALLPIRGKGGSDWSYAWIPVAAPLCGAALAAWLYNMLL